MIADGGGHAVAFALARGRPTSSRSRRGCWAAGLLGCLPGAPPWAVADRGYSSRGFRGHVWSRGARPAIPAKRNEAPVACPDRAYATHRERRSRWVERLRGRLKEWRAVATRHGKTARSFTGVLCLAAALDRLRR